MRAFAIVLLLAGTARAGVDLPSAPLRGAARPGKAGAFDLDAVTKAAPGCDASRAHCFAIQLHVAADDAALVAPADWIAEQLAEANRQFAAIDVAFRLAGVDSLPAAAFHIANRSDRDELAAHRAGAPRIDVFVIGRLDDIDEAGAIAYGVTWRIKDGRKYILVSNAAMPRTLAHELGHFFGLPHSSYAISIMNKRKRADPPPEQRTFAPPEVAAMRKTLVQLLRDKIIAD